MLLYLHIPFCHRVCPYCSFHKHTPGNISVPGFTDALISEIRARVTNPPRTIYLGGGTPSMLPPAQLRKLFTALRDTCDLPNAAEVTLEANPATFDAAKAALFRTLGVTRVSLGIQSFAPHVLHTLGREHDPDQAGDSVKLLHEAGIPRINIDLMFSVPGQTPEDWARTLETAISLQPHHISAYNLTYEEDTAFLESLRDGTFRADEDADARMFGMAEDLLEKAGFEHYETSNYARPGMRSTHNEGYWNGEDYLGLGPSAVSTIGHIRSRNIADTAAYMRMIASIGNATTESEELDTAARRIERIALGLRTSAGIQLDLLDPTGLARARILADEGLARIADARLVPTGRGRALVDAIAAELI